MVERVHPHIAWLGSAALSLGLSASLTTPGLAAAHTTAATPDAPSCRAPEPMSFAEQTYVDTTRAGGEPTVEMHPDGLLLYGAHAGTTHVFAPEAGDEDSSAFTDHYTGQAYYWWSDDLGATWHFSDRTLPPNGVPGSGFSDPEFAVDSAGQVYISEINLANVAVSKSVDSGRTYALQNLAGQTMEDRQWMAGDQRDVLYMTGNLLGGGTFPNDPAGGVGHHLFKSTDGGTTFAPGVEDPDGLGDIQVDQRDGTLYEARLADGTLQMAAFRQARDDVLVPDVSTIATGVELNAHWPSFDLDPAGNLYLTWDERGQGARPAGVYYAHSTDRGRSWSRPVRVDTDGNTDLWPWIAVGDRGRVAVAWLEADRPL
ncbi:MAG: sialidase family protein, partial [Carbonactinosporaceae bacterium]